MLRDSCSQLMHTSIQGCGSHTAHVCIDGPKTRWQLQSMYTTVYTFIVTYILENKY